MQRKKMPVLLISVLAVAAAVAMFANSSFATASSEDHSHDEQQMHDEPIPEKADPAETKRLMAESLKGNASPGKPSHQPSLAPVGEGKSDTPTIQNNNGARNKPQPSEDISTAGQWYTEESRASKK